MLGLREAVEKAVTECILEGILKDFLLKYRKEAIEVSIYEYDEAQAIKFIRQDEFQAGKIEGREEGENSFAALTEKLIRDSRMEDLLKATQDKNFRDILYDEYHITKE